MKGGGQKDREREREVREAAGQRDEAEDTEEKDKRKAQREKTDLKCVGEAPREGRRRRAGVINKRRRMRMDFRPRQDGRKAKEECEKRERRMREQDH